MIGLGESFIGMAVIIQRVNQRGFYRHRGMHIIALLAILEADLNSNT